MSAAGRDAPQISPLVRAAIIVADLERSLAFYRDVLGLDEIFFAGRLADAAAARLLGMPEPAELRCAIVRAAGPALGMIGLFEVAGAAPPRQRDAAAGVRRGDTCLVFNHSDLERLSSRLRAAGHEVVCPPTRLQIAPDLVSVEMTFRDPDGVLINCIERVS